MEQNLPIGTILNSGEREYRIEKVLGQGGFGITYLATATIFAGNIPIEAKFAIKEHYISSMNERKGTSVAISNANNTEEIKESIDSFLVEAQRLNKLSLNHPGIVRVNESFRANGTAYYVMEYIQGQSLRDYVKHSSLGRLSESEALKFFRPVAETVGYLHDHRVTHLDIKPDNILIRENGSPVLIDFGLSKHYSANGTPTSTIKAAGCSAGYSPMEQYVGITTFTPEADIYALGATLLYMLTGKDPVVATEINAAIINRSFPTDVSNTVRNAVIQSMEMLKSNRMSSVRELLHSFGVEYANTKEGGKQQMNDTHETLKFSCRQEVNSTNNIYQPTTSATDNSLMEYLEAKVRLNRTMFFCTIPPLMLVWFTGYGGFNSSMFGTYSGTLVSMIAIVAMTIICALRLRDAGKSQWWTVAPTSFFSILSLVWLFFGIAKEVYFIITGIEILSGLISWITLILCCFPTKEK